MIRGLAAALMVCVGAMGGSTGCSLLAGADFDVRMRASDAAGDTPADSPRLGEGSTGNQKDADSILPDGMRVGDATTSDGAALGADAADTGPSKGDSDVAREDASTPDADDTARDAGIVEDSAGQPDVIDEPPPPDGGTGDPPDGGPGDPPDGGTGDPPDGGTGDPPDGGDGRDADAGPEPREEGGLRPTIVTGGFVSLGPPNQVVPPIELRGHIVSNATVSGRSSNGVTIEGRFQ